MDQFNYTLSIPSNSLQRLENTRLALRQLEEDNLSRYPDLAKILQARNGAKLKRLRNILDYLARPEETSFTTAGDGKAYTDIPARELVGLYGGSMTTYVSVLNLCCMIGLLEKHNPNRIDREHQTELDQTARKYAQHRRGELRIRRRNRYNARVYYYLPPWTDELMQRAEELIKGNVPTLTRAIDQYGGEQAQRGLDTWRRIPGKTERAREQIDTYVADQLTRKGYTTSAEIMRGCGYLVRQGINLKRVVDDYLRTMCKAYDLSYHAPTAEERETYNLTGRGWIITQQHNNTNGGKDNGNNNSQEQEA